MQIESLYELYFSSLAKTSITSITGSAKDIMNSHKRQLLFNYLTRSLILRGQLLETLTSRRTGFSQLDPIAVESTYVTLSNLLEFLCIGPNEEFRSKDGTGAIIVRATKEQQVPSYPIVLVGPRTFVSDSMNSFEFRTVDNVVQKCVEIGSVITGSKVKIHSAFGHSIELFPSNDGLIPPVSITVIPLLYSQERCGSIYVFTNKPMEHDDLHMSQFALIGPIVGSIISRIPSSHHVKSGTIEKNETFE